jgi:hypothetical protein
MLGVEMRIEGNDELADRVLETFWNWLQQRKLKPLSYRYVFNARGVVFRVGFSELIDATAFAHQFGGKLIDAQNFSSVEWTTENAIGAA